MNCLLEVLYAVSAKIVECLVPVIKIIKVDAAMLEVEILEFTKTLNQKLSTEDEKAIVKSAQALLGEGAKLSEDDLDDFIDSHVYAAVALINAHGTNSNIPYSEYDAHFSETNPKPINDNESNVIGALSMNDEC